MCNPFIYANKVKRRFAALGCYYRLMLPDGDEALFRSVLDIMTVERYAELGSPVSYTCRDLLLKSPDAFICMLNPGKSEPFPSTYPKRLYPGWNPEYIIPTVNWDDTLSTQVLNTLAVPTKVDKAQYQWMRIMLCAGWRHIRILNTSDLQEADSPVFFNNIARDGEYYNNYIHSIFADSRREELQLSYADHTGKPVWKAWGTEAPNSKARNLFHQVQGKLNIDGRKLYGISVPTDQILFRYISPRFQDPKQVLQDFLLHMGLRECPTCCNPLIL